MAEKKLNFKDLPIPSAREEITSTAPNVPIVPIGTFGTIPPEETKEREIPQGGLISSEPITPEDLDYLSKKYGGAITPEQLKDYVPALGGINKEMAELGILDLDAEAASVAGRTILAQVDRAFGGLYGKSIRSGQVDPKVEAALDELNSIIKRKQSFLLDGTQMLGGAYNIAKGATSLANKLAPQAPVAAERAALFGTGLLEGAAQGLGQSKRGEEAADTIIGATVGGIAGLIPGLYGMYQDKSSKVLAKLTEEVEQSSAQLDTIVEGVIDNTKGLITAQKEAIKANLEGFEEFISSTTSEMRKVLAPKVPAEGTEKFSTLNNLAKEYFGKEGPEAVQDMLALGKAQDTVQLLEKRAGVGIDKIIQQGRAEKLLDEVVYEEAALKAIEKWSAPKLADNALTKAAITFSDGRAVANMIDQKYGTSMAKTLGEGSRKLNLYTFELKDRAKAILNLDKRTKAFNKGLEKAGQKALSQEDLYNKLDMTPSANEPEIVKQYRQLFADGLKLAQEKGLDVQDLTKGGQGYVPHRRLKVVDYSSALRKELAKFPTDNPEQIKALMKETDGSFTDLVKELESVSRLPIKTLEDFYGVTNRLLKDPSELRSGLNNKAFALESRTDQGIPYWAREKNLTALARDWYTTTMRYAAVRPTLDQLQTFANIAKKSEDDFTHKYITNLMADVIGSRTNTVASSGRKTIEKLQLAARYRADKAPKGSIRESYWKAAEEAPALIANMQNNLYTAYLGWNPKSTIQNLTSFYFQGVPELGTGFGHRVVLESMVDMAKHLGKFKGLGELVENRGILPKQWDGENLAAIGKGAKESGLSKVGSNYDKIMMYSFNQSERMARGMTTLIGERVGNYMAKDPRIARNLIARISDSSYRRSLESLYKKGDIEGLKKEWVDYLQDKAMMNYDRLNMSEYGRYMGPAFSIFSKWPTSVAGKILQNQMAGHRAGFLRNFKTMAVPFGTLQLVDHLMDEDWVGSKDLQEKILGRKGLSGWTALDSFPLNASIKEGILASPVLSAATDLGQAAHKVGKSAISGALDQVLGRSEGESEISDALEQWLERSATSFVKGGGAYRLLFKDLPLYMTGEKPKKERD